MKVLKTGLFFVVLAALSMALRSDEPGWKLPPETARLRPGPGADLASANCLLCHSADYIAMQPPLDRAGWQATVQKMREKYGSPLPADKVEEIVTYLAAQYGKGAR